VAKFKETSFMKANLSKKILSCLISAFIVLNPLKLSAQETAASAGLFDESVKDISVVLGAGAAGAILGLSTLSFVEEPKEHTKNIAIGGAIGIVIGVGMVMFGQATKSQSTIMGQNNASENSSELNLKKFREEKIAQNYLQIPTVDFSFSF
jgi:hypothetical protein